MRHEVPFELPPYARSLGIELADGCEGRVLGGGPVVSVRFDQSVEGRPGHLHGGAIAGLLETAGYVALAETLEATTRPARMKPINLTVQFLAAGRRRASFAQARIVKLGRRTANVAVEAWQEGEERAIASAVMNILLADARS
jgi:uncharacterized protein (TIGR00369 family)